MKCRYCNAEIKSDELYCRNCGREIRIVPDYNPIDEVLEAEIKDSLNNNDSSNRTAGRNTHGVKRSKEDTLRRQKEQRRAQAEKKRAKKKKRRIILLSVLLIIIAVIITASVLIYRNSYNGLISRGDKAAQEQDYDLAESYYNKAIDKKPEDVKAYDALSKLYMSMDDKDAALKVYTDAISDMNTNADLYESLIQFYIDEEQPEEVTELMDNAPDSVRDKLSKYIIDVPQFSLDDEPVYDDVQQLTLDAGGLDIYYTLDGTDPVANGAKYSEPIQISNEGTLVVSAVAKDKNGIPSVTVSKSYTITFPVIDAPSISPSTGQYSTAEQIEIKVPDGYTAYYTTDGSNPTNESTPYEGPIDMPAGNTIFKAVLVDSAGRMSGISTRNYVYEAE